MFLALSLKIKRLEREVGGSRPSSGANVKNVWNTTSNILTGLHGMVMVHLSIPYTVELHKVRPDKGDIEPADGHTHLLHTGNYNCYLYTGFPVHQELGQAVRTVQSINGQMAQTIVK